MLGKPDKSARHVPGSLSHTHTHKHTYSHSCTESSLLLEAPEGSRNKSHKIMCHEMGIVVAWLHHKLYTTPPPSFYHALRPPSSIRLAKESPSRLATWPRFTASLAAACRRLLANFLQRNFGDASVPPADTATCRAPASSLRSVPPPVTLTLDLTLLEFFNYTTSASSGIGKRWRTCNAGAAARQLDVKQCASMCGKVAALRSAMLQPV